MACFVSWLFVFFVTITTAITTECPKCGTYKGKRSCCFYAGAWFRKCGAIGDSTFDHTWIDGVQACKPPAVTMPPITARGFILYKPPVTAAIPGGCPKCGTNKISGKRSCCFDGGAWFGKCGDIGDSTFDHTWIDGIQACAPPAVTTTPIITAIPGACPKCGTNKISGQRSCCLHGGAWFGKCGDIGDSTFDYDWFEGIQACKDKLTLSVTAETSTPAATTPPTTAAITTASKMSTTTPSTTANTTPRTATPGTTAIATPSTTAITTARTAGYGSEAAGHAATTDSKARGELTNIVSLICVLLATLRTQM